MKKIEITKIGNTEITSHTNGRRSKIRQEVAQELLLELLKELQIGVTVVLSCPYGGNVNIYHRDGSFCIADLGIHHIPGKATPPCKTLLCITDEGEIFTDTGYRTALHCDIVI